MTSDGRQLHDARTELIERAYRLSTGEAAGEAWDELLARAASDDGPITVIEIAAIDPERRALHETYVNAAGAATEAQGGAVTAVCDIVEPGTGDLSSLMDYAGGVATLLAFPSRAAYLTALASERWQSSLDARRAAVRDAIILIAGENAIPPMARAMFGEPRPASAFATPRVDGKAPEALIDELLTVYPDGGADPSRAQLEVMMRFPGFREQPVHYINLYAFGDGGDPAVKGEAAHDAYNLAAMQPVLAHGGFPLLRAPVAHRLASTIPWSRVVFVRWPSLAVFTDMRLAPEYIEAQKHRVESAETYGNFVTVKRDARA